MLSDRSIRAALNSGRLRIHPLADDTVIQPSSVDVHLAADFRVFDSHAHQVIDPRRLPADLTREVVASADRPFVLHPGQFVLASTVETIGVPDDLVARVEGKSSLGRCGLCVHATAGFVDAGFQGQITLELSNVASLPVLLYPGMKIAQLAFQQLDGPAERPYGHPDLNSKYQGQSGPTASRYHRNR